MPVEGSAPTTRDDLCFVESGSEFEGFEFCETFTAKKAQLFVQRSGGILHKTTTTKT